MYSCPPHSSGLTSRCDRPPGPAAGTGSLPEIPGPRAVSGTAAAGAELKPEGEAEGVIWASGPQHSLPSDPTKIKLISTFTSSPKPCARDPFGLLRQVVWWQKESGTAALGLENLPLETFQWGEVLVSSPLVPK